MNVSFYCVNFKDEERRSNMIKRFEILGMELKFVEPVYITDPRLDIESINSNIGTKRIWSIMLQHLDSIQDFYENTTNEYMILCEDDILLSKDMLINLPSILETFQELNLDVLLLGCLLNFKIDRQMIYQDYNVMKETEKYTYYDFPYHVWGSQMYLIDRNHAKFLLDKYTIDYALADLNRPFNPDWTLTKDGKKCMIYPMIAIEEGVSKSDHGGQNYFHLECFRVNYDENVYF
jgi:hypothetical protein